MNGFFFSCGSDLVNAEKGLLHGGKRGRQLRFIVEGRRVRVVGEGSGAHPECDDLVLVVVAVAVVVSSPATTAIRRAARANSNRAIVVRSTGTFDSDLGALSPMRRVGH